MLRKLGKIWGCFQKMETLHNENSIKAFSQNVLSKMKNNLNNDFGHFTSKLMPSGRRGMAPFGIFGVAVGTVALVAGGIWYGSTMQGDGESKTLSITGSSQVDGQPELVASNIGIDANIADACPDDKAVDFQTRVRNLLKTGSAEYLNVTGYLVSTNSNNDPLSYTTVDSSYPTAITPRCDGKTQSKFVTVANNETSFSFEENIGLFSADFKQTFEAEKFGRLTVKAKDVIGDAWIYDNLDTSATDYDSAPLTFKTSTSNATAFSLGSDTEFQWQFWLKTTSNTQFGENELPVYIAVDADTTDYQVPALAIDGVPLVDVKTAGKLNSRDLSVLSGYEYVFKVPQARFGSSNRILTYGVTSTSGVDPDVDIKIRPLAVTRFLAQDGVTVETGVFKDDTGFTEAASGLSQEITIDIS